MKTPLVALLASLALLTPGCVLSSAALAQGRIQVPEQTATIVDGRVVIRDAGGDRLRSRALPPGLDPAVLRLTGGPVRDQCRCEVTAYGLVASVEPFPYRLERQGPHGDWEPTREAFDPITRPGGTWSRVLLPLALCVDLALLPAELVFVGISVATEEERPRDLAIEVAVDDASVQTSPGPEGPVLGRARRGQRFVASRERDGGWQIGWGGGCAWVASTEVVRIGADGVAARTRLAVRAAPSATADALGWADDGQVLVRLRQAGEWLLVQYDDRQGWVPAGRVDHVPLR